MTWISLKGGRNFFLSFFQCVRHPIALYLGEGHLRDDGEHDLLPLGGVGVLLVLVQPRLQRRRRLARHIRPSGGQAVGTAVAVGRQGGRVVRVVAGRRGGQARAAPGRHIRPAAAALL
jgi:hypothetical protein